MSSDCGAGASPMTPTIAADFSTAVARVSFNRPEKRNALTVEMLDGLAAAIAQAIACDSACLLLTGEGQTFCAGFDLAACRDDPLAMEQLLRGLSRAASALRAAPFPVVISAHGGAIAGGCALLCAADIVITTTNAKIGYPVVRLGISPAVSAPLLRLAVGNGPARVRLLDSAVIDGARAVEIGLAQEALDTGEACVARAAAVADSLAAKPLNAMRQTKAWLNELEAESLSTMQRALAASVSLVGGDEERRLLAEMWKPR